MRIDIKQIALSFMSLVVRGAILVFVVSMIYKAGQKAYDFGFRIFTEEAMSAEPGRDVAVTIVQGDSDLDIGRDFEEKGLIRDPYLFMIQKKCSLYDADIKPGFYTLNTSMTAEDMFAIIAGKSDDEEADEAEEVAPKMSTPLTEAAPLVEQTGDGEWEGSEEDESDVAAEAENATIDIVVDAPGAE